MSEKEESMILVIGNTQDIDNLAYLFPWEKLEKTKRVIFTRSEVVHRMAVAMSNDDSLLPHYERLAEAALDALIK